MTNLAKHAEDRHYNSLLKTGNPLLLLIAVVVKYGVGPVACIYMGWLVYQKDLTLEADKKVMVEMIREDTRAKVEQTEAIRALARTLEAQTQKIADLDRDRKWKGNGS